jgi:hypothetical protein
VGRPNSNSKRGECSGRMYRCIVYVLRKKIPLIPVGLILIYIMSVVLSQHTLTPLDTPLRFGMKCSRLNFLILRILHVFLNTSLIKLVP